MEQKPPAIGIPKAVSKKAVQAGRVLLPEPDEDFERMMALDEDDDSGVWT